MRITTGLLLFFVGVTLLFFVMSYSVDYLNSEGRGWDGRCKDLGHSGFYDTTDEHNVICFGNNDTFVIYQRENYDRKLVKISSKKEVEK